MRAEGGRIALFDRHLARLAASAAALGYPLDAEVVRQRVAAEAGEGVRGVRLTLGGAGDLEVTSWDLDAAPFRTAWIDPEPHWDAGTWRTAHKTTARDAYRQRHERALMHRADEAILVNARREVTEGTRTNVWAEIDGRLWTPPLAAGGLGGVMRAHVLDTRSDAGERLLTPDAVRGADAVFLSNALRGWMPVEVLG